MDNIWEFIIGFANEAWNYLVEIFETIILPILISWMDEVIEYFRSLALQRGTHVPFIMNTSPGVNNPFSNLISDELRGEGIIEGVYNSKSDTIEKLRYIGGNGMDDQIKETIEENPITVLM